MFERHPDRGCQSAFTLIELLVSVAIVGMLIAILLPSLARARDHARTVKCMALIREDGKGVQTFAQTHRGLFQLVANYQYGVRQADPARTVYVYQGMQQEELVLWPVVLLREMGIRLPTNLDWGQLDVAPGANVVESRLRRFDVMRCPSDASGVSTPYFPPGPTVAGQDQRYYGYLSYGINEDVVGARSENLDGIVRNLGNPDPPVWKSGNKGGNHKRKAGERLMGRLDKVVRPYEVLLLVDAGASEAPGDTSAERPNLLTTCDATGGYLQHVEARWGLMPTGRHRPGGLNVAYVDGHAAFAKKVQITLVPYVPRPRPAATGTMERYPLWYYRPAVRVTPYDP
jgi:prepilin-type N-terminal cleavage/methylation domain-containing protein/prepilin-type processing-associated H-X9-DG protein